MGFILLPTIQAIRREVPCCRSMPSKISATKKRPPPTSTVTLKDGTRVLYELTEMPDRRGPPGAVAVFLHDFMTDRRLFAPQFSPTFTGAIRVKRRCLRYDLRGFGETIGDISLEEGYSHARDLMEILELLGLGQEKVHLVGCGMGGNIALDVALDFPDHVLSVACVSSGLEGHRWSEENFFQVADGSLGDLGEWKREWIRRNKTWSVVDQTSTVGRRLMAMAETYKGQHFFVPSNCIRLDERPTIRRLNEIQAPVLAVVGKDDVPSFLKINEEIFEGVAKPFLSRAEWVPNATHWMTLENPMALKGFLEQMWDSIEPPT